jgi:uncharacterized protein (TIGR00297 family)
MALAVAALGYGVFVSPRLLRKTRRPDEEVRVYSPGKAAYALSVLGLLVVFPGDMYIVGAVWANLSVGDAASNLIGRNFGKKRLPWNGEKTWLGTVAAFLLSALAGAILMRWIGLPAGTHNPAATAWSYSVSLSLVCSLVETLPLPVDDNFTICLAGGAFMGFVTQAAWPPHWSWPAAGIGFLISAGAALLARMLKTVSVGGALWGTLMGSVVYVALGATGFILLGTFFILGSLFSKIGYARKETAGIAQPNRGMRSGRHVWGKGLAALLAALAALFLADDSRIMLAFVAALATSLCDTTATELGQLYGKRAVLLTNLAPVPRGTAGAVSIEGSLLGLLAAIGIASMGYAFRFVTSWGVLWAVTAAVLATHLESYLVSSRRQSKVNGPLMNGFHTTLAMLLAVLLSRIHS